MPNSSLSRIKCFLKIHQEDNEVREIIATTNSPIQNIAQWLLEEVKSLGLKIGKWEVITRFSEAGGIQIDEILVSFNVKAMFPKVPMKETLYLIEEWITTHENSTEWRKKAKLYRKLSFRCTNESYFGGNRQLSLTAGMRGIHGESGE